MKSTAVTVGVVEMVAVLLAVTARAAGATVAGDTDNTLEVGVFAPSKIGSVVVPVTRLGIGDTEAPLPPIGEGDSTDVEPNMDAEVSEDGSTVEGEGAAGLRFLLSKSAKLAKPPPLLLSPNASDDIIDAGGAGFVGVGPCSGLGGAGLGGGCFAFFGGKAGLGDSGRGGATDLLGLGETI